MNSFHFSTDSDSFLKNAGQIVFQHFESTLRLISGHHVSSIAHSDKRKCSHVVFAITRFVASSLIVQLRSVKKKNQNSKNLKFVFFYHPVFPRLRNWHSQFVVNPIFTASRSTVERDVWGEIEKESQTTTTPTNLRNKPSRVAFLQ